MMVSISMLKGVMNDVGIYSRVYVWYLNRNYAWFANREVEIYGNNKFNRNL